MERAREPRSTQLKPNSCNCELVPLAENLKKTTTETMMDMAHVVDKENPEDLLSKFRKSMDQLGRDKPSSQRGGLHLGGGGGGRPGDDGGDDGSHRSIASSRRSQAGDDGYGGVRRWHTTPKPKTKRLEIFKDWIAKAVLVMGTWATGVQGWFQARADRARKKHEHWLSVLPEARATLEKQYML
eukprot:1444925-Amphidinium_carterae.1